MSAANVTPNSFGRGPRPSPAATHSNRRGGYLDDWANRRDRELKVPDRSLGALRFDPEAPKFDRSAAASYVA
jgi:hypothetical protein